VLVARAFRIHSNCTREREAEAQAQGTYEPLVTEELWEKVRATHQSDSWYTAEAGGRSCERVLASGRASIRAGR
jgi:hypothetical protein